MKEVAVKKAFQKLLFVSAILSLGGLEAVQAQEVSRMRIWWDVAAPPGALYLNICSDPRINNNPRTGGCGRIDVLNENATKNKEQFRFVDDRLKVGSEYRACLVADQTRGRSGRWMVCRDFVAQDGGEVALNGSLLRPIRANP
jgi:hypothetical protein